MEDWLTDPLQNRKPKLEDEKVKAWDSFHFTTRLKLEGAVYFCSFLLGVTSLPDNFGLPLLIHRQTKWYAEAFFFELCSAFEILLQEINVLYECNLETDKVTWEKLKKTEKLPQLLREKVDSGYRSDWFKKVRWYRNTATHRYYLPMMQSTIGVHEQPWSQEMEKVDLIYFDEESNRFASEDIKSCVDYLRHMLSYINGIWSVMKESF